MRTLKLSFRPARVNILARDRAANFRYFLTQTIFSSRYFGPQMRITRSRRTVLIAMLALGPSFLGAGPTEHCAVTQQPGHERGHEGADSGAQSVPVPCPLTGMTACASITLPGTAASIVEMPTRTTGRIANDDILPSTTCLIQVFHPPRL